MKIINGIVKSFIILLNLFIVIPFLTLLNIITIGHIDNFGKFILGKHWDESVFSWND